MLESLRGGCGEKGGRLLLVGKNALLCKVCSMTTLDMNLIYWCNCLIIEFLDYVTACSI